jgi:hypothetical protein
VVTVAVTGAPVIVVVAVLVVVTGAPVTVVVAVAVLVVVTGAPVTVVVTAGAVCVVVLVTVLVFVTVLVTVSVVVFGAQALKAPAAITAPPATRKSRLEMSFFLLSGFFFSAISISNLPNLYYLIKNIYIYIITLFFKISYFSIFNDYYRLFNIDT